MKTQGKIPVAKSDFVIVSERLSNGKDRLKKLQNSHKLTQEQQEAISSITSKIERLQEAAIECNKADSINFPGARRKAIGETIAHFDLNNIDFDQEYGVFGLMERFEENRANVIDRDLYVKNLVADSRGFEVDAQYQETSSY